MKVVVVVAAKKKVSRRQIAPSSAALRKPITTLASKGREIEKGKQAWNFHLIHQKTSLDA